MQFAMKTTLWGLIMLVVIFPVNTAHQGSLDIAAIFSGADWAKANKTINVTAQFDFHGLSFQLCNRTFNYSAKTFEISDGATVDVSPAEAKDAPTQLQFPVLSPNADQENFTLLMMDVDVPNSNVGTLTKPIMHWLIMNRQPASAAGEEVLSYRGPMPPNPGSPHRYILLLLEQPSAINKSVAAQYSPSTCPSTLQGRCLFDVSRFASEQQLKLRGQAYFRAENDAYVNMRNYDASRQCDYCNWLPQCDSGAKAPAIAFALGLMLLLHLY